MNTEVEMKAKITPNQIQNLLSVLKRTDCEFLIKQDEYFTCKGKDVSKFKEKIRIRKEEKYYLSHVFFFSHTSTKIEQLLTLSKDWEKFVNTGNKIEKTWLTFKDKTLKDKTEVNNESEGQLFVGTEEAFRKIMKVAGYEVSFKKVKISLSWYKDGLHFELVRVAGIDDFYLEVESVENGKTDITTSVGKLHRIFANLGITEFETRDWKTLTKENKNKDKE